MVSIVVRITGAKELVAYLGKVRGRIPDRLDGMSRNLAYKMASVAKQLVGPYHSGTGALEKSIKAVKQGRNNYIVTASALNESGENYAYFQEFGFARHRVRVSRMSPNARLRGVLNPRSAIEVSMHTPFMRPAADRVMKEDFPVEGRRFLDDVLRK